MTEPITNTLKRLRALSALVAAAICAMPLRPVFASPDVNGEVATFTSPGGVRERCVAVRHVPGGSYSEDDRRREAALCAIDFHGDAHALCPKVFSTSPGTLVYDLAGGEWEGRRAEFERTACAAGGLRKPDTRGEPVSFKMSVNGETTSATFANASLIYYHFSRYLDGSIHVPVAVLRSVDRAQHAERVSVRGLALSGKSASLKMNHDAWQTLLAAEREPSGYRPRSELFTPDGQVYGVLLHPVGKRYSEEFNGTRASGWGDGQSRDFQETAPFRAMRSDKPLMQAIDEGRRAAMADRRLAKATGADATPAQMVYWMSDLIDITLIDFIFSQQDRIGNIDYVDTWHWIADGKLHTRAAEGRAPPADIAAFDPVRLKRTELGDNDAGVRLSYANYTKRTGMLENLRHYRAGAYQRLMRLRQDFAARGPLYDYVRSSFGLSGQEFARVVENTGLAADILRSSCEAGLLRFDVEPEEFLRTGKVEPAPVAC